MLPFACVELTRHHKSGAKRQEKTKHKARLWERKGVKVMAEKELEITTNTYIFAGVGAVLLGGLAAAALGGLQNTIAAGVVGALAGGCLGIFF